MAKVHAETEGMKEMKKVTKMSKESIIRKEVGKLQKMSPLKRAFRLKKMLEELRGERLDLKNENLRRIVGRVKQK